MRKVILAPMGVPQNGLRGAGKVDSRVEAFWGQFRSTLSEGSGLENRYHEAWCFGDNAQGARHC